jgi:uncharacterized protein (DUF2235 family)
MSKRIIFCADGTWDDTESNTNVLTMFDAVAVTADQISFYDSGVGADGAPIQKLAGGAFGDGLFQKVQDGYTKIAHVYTPGDEIFLFGFSRGAYTARSLAGMIAICGLPSAGFDDKLVETAFQAYRQPAQRDALLKSLSSYNLADAILKMVGVWDTVGSLGIPALEGKVATNCQFLDTNLHPDVLNAYQALAIDEKRREFPPTLWTTPAKPVPGQTLEQVWFTGVHCDVGGGYPETGLSDITLSWMMGKARALGVVFPDGVWEEFGPIEAKNALSPAHESWNLLWGFPSPRNIPNNASFSNSVPLRIQVDNTYQPGNMALINRALAPSYGTVQVVTPLG